MQQGVPVIATPIAVEGFPEEIKKIINVASASKEFADSVIRFLKEPDLRKQFMELDKSIIIEMLSWENIVGQFEDDLVDEMKKII